MQRDTVKVRCGLVEDSTVIPAEGSTQELCCVCGKPVWVSPNTRRQLAEHVCLFQCVGCNVSVMLEDLAEGVGVNFIPRNPEATERHEAHKRRVAERN